MITRNAIIPFSLEYDKQRSAPHFKAARKDLDELRNLTTITKDVSAQAGEGLGQTLTKGIEATRVGEKLGENLKKGVQEASAPIGATLQGTLSKVGAMAKTLGGGLTTVLTGALSTALKGVQGVVKGVFSAVKGVGSSLTQAGKTMASMAFPSLEPLISQARGLHDLLGIGLGLAMQKAFSYAKMDAIAGSSMMRMQQNITELGYEMSQSMMPSIRALSDTFERLSGSEAIKNIFGQIGDISSLLIDMFNMIVVGVQKMGFLELIGDILTIIGEAFEEVMAVFADSGDIFNSLKESVAIFGDALKDIFKSLKPLIQPVVRLFMLVVAAIARMFAVFTKISGKIQKFVLNLLSAFKPLQDFFYLIEDILIFGAGGKSRIGQQIADFNNKLLGGLKPYANAADYRERNKGKDFPAYLTGGAVRDSVTGEEKPEDVIPPKISPSGQPNKAYLQWLKEQKGNTTITQNNNNHITINVKDNDTAKNIENALPDKLIEIHGMGVELLEATLANP